MGRPAFLFFHAAASTEFYTLSLHDALPIWFVGTVRGIGRALQEAQGALRGDISGVTLGLGITFNATLTALISCIVVMFCLHQLQQAQDRLVLDARGYIDRRLIRNMRVN